MRAVAFCYSNVGDRCLRVLQARGIDISLVVTHRDQPNERLWFQRVSDTAAELCLPFVYAEDLAADDLRAAVAAARPDVIFSFYYRNMIPAAVLELAPGGAFNMHGSLLPKYRGRAPTNWAVLQGEIETGATLHEMVAKPDAGAIIDQLAVPILPDDTGQQVFDKVAVAAEQILWRSLPALLAGTAVRHPNDLAAGSYFSRRTPEDGRIDWSRSAAQVYNLIRAVAPPYPGAFTDIGIHRLVIGSAKRVTTPDIVASADWSLGLNAVENRIIALCGDGGLIEVRQLLAGASALDATALRSLFETHKSQ
ncbi:MAG: formyltransferase [Herminiimonas sp.]|nr:formyltransferase [Herminiimonas sp.]